MEVFFFRSWPLFMDIQPFGDGIFLRSDRKKKYRRASALCGPHSHAAGPVDMLGPAIGSAFFSYWSLLSFNAFEWFHIHFMPFFFVGCS
jgi:hypothetical protein